jgi:ligand-binding sensor domain-containing protein
MFTLDCAVLRAQSIPFVPPSYNYGSNTYNAGSQNWSVAQGKDGVIYIANNDGLLSFDGVNWRLHLLPFNRGAKSVYVDRHAEKERIYVGSFEEFGYFEKNAANQLEYHSLKALLESYTFHNDEIWTIHKLGDEIFFQSFSSYFVSTKQNAP